MPLFDPCYKPVCEHVFLFPFDWSPYQYYCSMEDSCVQVAIKYMRENRNK